ncbi:hypothetical protein BJV77DRAFT_218978 [Russula vinacea]|nr:hypothetical protein BJV77DRAFT_218978 [Russula vinacea]
MSCVRRFFNIECLDHWHLRIWDASGMFDLFLSPGPSLKLGLSTTVLALTVSTCQSLTPRLHIYCCFVSSIVLSIVQWTSCCPSHLPFQRVSTCMGVTGQGKDTLAYRNSHPLLLNSQSGLSRIPGSAWQRDFGCVSRSDLPTHPFRERATAVARAPHAGEGSRRLLLLPARNALSMRTAHTPGCRLACQICQNPQNLENSS